ncbi:MAG: hypothetical protein R3C18_06915 [Planctomycetaceae bacterium]
MSGHGQWSVHTNRDVFCRSRQRLAHDGLSSFDSDFGFINDSPAGRGHSLAELAAVVNGGQDMVDGFVQLVLEWFTNRAVWEVVTGFGERP